VAITVESWIPVVPTLIVGVGVVVLSAAGFAIAMFGRRPLPQIATTPARSDPAAVNTVSTHAASARRRPGRAAGTAPRARRDEPRLQVEVPAQVRIRSAFLLGLGVIVAAGVIGLITSIVVVGFFTLLG